MNKRVITPAAKMYGGPKMYPVKWYWLSVFNKQGQLIFSWQGRTLDSYLNAQDEANDELRRIYNPLRNPNVVVEKLLPTKA